MSEIRLTIRGVIFALFPQYDKTNPDSDEMINQTVERLAELDRTRPEVILMPEPENIYDHKAVRAYCGGSSIGYVAHEETMEASRLFDASRPMVKARIVEVEVKRKGNLFVVAELPAEALVKPLPKVDATEAWRQWRCSVPQLPIPDTWKDCRVLEFQMKSLFDNPDEENIKSLKNYLSVWIDKSLHDFSVEAVEECQPFFWAKSAWAVVFCVCRDYYGVPDNVSAFEKRITRLELSKIVKEYSNGTIHMALCNNDYLKKHISKWDDGRALVLAKELKSILDNNQ